MTVPSEGHTVDCGCGTKVWVGTGLGGCGLLRAGAPALQSRGLSLRRDQHVPGGWRGCAMRLSVGRPRGLVWIWWPQGALCARLGCADSLGGLWVASGLWGVCGAVADSCLRPPTPPACSACRRPPPATLWGRPRPHSRVVRGCPPCPPPRTLLTSDSGSIPFPASWAPKAAAAGS